MTPENDKVQISRIQNRHNTIQLTVCLFSALFFLTLIGVSCESSDQRELEHERAEMQACFDSGRVWTDIRPEDSSYALKGCKG